MDDKTREKVIGLSPYLRKFLAVLTPDAAEGKVEGVTVTLQPAHIAALASIVDDPFMSSADDHRYAEIAVGIMEDVTTEPPTSAQSQQEAPQQDTPAQAEPLLFTSEEMRDVRQVSSDHIESKRRLRVALKGIGEQAELLYHGKEIVEAVDTALHESRGGE